MTNYILDIALIGLVVLQVRGRRFSPITLVIPLAVVAYFAVQYLHGFPTTGNDLVLELGGAGLGAALGIGCALTTHFHREKGGALIVRAGVAAAALWIAGVGGRLAFQLYAEHGGGPALYRFSAAHALTQDGWVTALVLMALAEVVCRSAGIALRAWRAGALRVPRLAAAPAGSTVVE